MPLSNALQPISDSEIEAIVQTPDFQRRMNLSGPLLLLSGERRGLSAIAIKREIDAFARDMAIRILETSEVR